MPALTLQGCTATPLGAYLKALGVFRLVSEQVDPEALASWDGDTFVLDSSLSLDTLLAFFLEQYRPTPILAPWNGGSGFYPKDNKDAINAIASSDHPRFAAYRQAIEVCRTFPEIEGGKSDAEDERRTAILLQCRNWLDDAAVEWLDAAIGIAADGTRSFPPILGTGGNDGRLDYTNNFMARLVSLLISPDDAKSSASNLASAICGSRTLGLQAGAIGQFNPGRAGGANQGCGIESDPPTNPWDFVLTLEGAVAWASGLYRRQGIRYRTFLCSPFTVRAEPVGYGSASLSEQARAEIWAPLWRSQIPFSELKALLREGRATVDGRPAANALDFAEAARSLGVDRGIHQFVRYSLLMRRGKSYIALPAGTFPTGYRSESDLVRELRRCVSAATQGGIPKTADALRRQVDAATYQALLAPSQERMRDLMAALGRLLRRLSTTAATRPPSRALSARLWLEACSLERPEVRIAAALASIYTPKLGSLSAHFVNGDKLFAWSGRDLPDRLASVLERRLRLSSAEEQESGNPLGGACPVHPGDATLFIEGFVDDALLEDLLFAFTTLDWHDFNLPRVRSAEVIPLYAVLKHLFLPGKVELGGESQRLRADPRILSFLAAARIDDAAEVALTRLRIAGGSPISVEYHGGVDARRLAASLLIPVSPVRELSYGIFHTQESPVESHP